MVRAVVVVEVVGGVGEVEATSTHESVQSDAGRGRDVDPARDG